MKELELKYKAEGITVAGIIGRLKSLKLNEDIDEFRLNLSNSPQLNYYYISAADSESSLRLREETFGNQRTVVSMIVKTAAEGDDAINGADRQEYSVMLGSTLAEADAFLLQSCMAEQRIARWARYRTEWSVIVKGEAFTISLDDNSGYGPLVEIEGPSEDAISELAELLALEWLSTEELGAMYKMVMADPELYFAEFVNNNVGIGKI